MLPLVNQSRRPFSRRGALALSLFALAAIAAPGVNVSRAPAAPVEENRPVDERPVLLADAVAEFNAQAAQDPIGKDQPPLTEDEVIASLRGIIRERTPMTDDVYNALQKVAVTRMLPAKAKLDFTTGWSGHNGFVFTVWWADLSIMTGEKTGYTYRLRDRMIASRLLTDRERERLKVELKAQKLEQAAREGER